MFPLVCLTRGTPVRPVRLSFGHSFGHGVEAWRRKRDFITGGNFRDKSKHKSLASVIHTESFTTVCARAPE